MEQLPAVEQKDTTHPTTVQHIAFRYLRPLAAAAVTVGIVLVGFLSYHAFEGQQDESALAGHNGGEGIDSTIGHLRGRIRPGCRLFHD